MKKYAIIVFTKINFLTILVLSFVQNNLFFGQIVTSNNQNNSALISNQNELYFFGSSRFTNRRLLENEGLFGEEIGIRVQEEGKWKSSYGIGLRTQLMPRFVLDMGFAYDKNAEFFSFSEADSLYEYTSSYRHIAVPFQVGFKIGKTVSFVYTMGIQPKAFISQKQEIRFLDQDGFEVTEKVIIKDGYNQFLLDLIVRTGCVFKISPKTGAFLMTEGFYQFTNNYTIQGPYKRFPFGIGVSAGISFFLDN